MSVGERPQGALERRGAGHGAGPDHGFGAMIDALRALQDDVTAAAPPEDVVAEVTRSLTELSRRLRAHAVEEQHQVTGHRHDVPGRAQAMAPVLHVDEESDTFRRARVRFGRFYLGSDGAVHGGAIPLAFAELVGWLAVSGGRSPARTAYLRVDYRSPTPIGQELRMAGWFEREEGRKRFLRATLQAGDRLCAEAEALYVALRP